MQTPENTQPPLHLIMGFNTLSQCRYGWMLYHTADKFVGRSLHKYGEFSEGEVALFRQILRVGQVVVEAGANFGTHTVAMAKMVGESGRIFAFEPQPLVLQTMVANAALNALTNVRPFHAALGAAPGSIKVPVLNPAKGHNFGGFSIDGHDSGDRVVVQTIDSLQLSRCHLIKVDVEGMESSVLEGARDTIARCRPALYVENDREEHSARLIEMIQSLDYRLWWHLPRLFNPDNFRRDPENVFGDIISVNMVCLPRESAARVDLREVHSPIDHWRVNG